jgi:hypothetical protein
LPLTVRFRGNEFDSVLNAAELKNRIGDFCEPAIQQLRTLLSAERPAAIQLGGRLADFPGFVEALGRLPRVAAVVQEQAAAGRGALRRAGSIKESESGYRLTTTVAWDQAAVDLDASVQSSTPVGNREQRPTHVLVNGLAYQLGVRAFHIGAELSSGDYGAPLDGRMTGVSRRHCTISVEDQGVVVSDHSRYGTRLNGHRIDGSAFLQVGDVLSLGDPAREFLLITEVIPDGT